MSETTRRWMIYGAYGYTGELIAREAQRKGLSPVLAGRDQTRLAEMEKLTGLDTRAFSLEQDFDAHLRDVDAVLHCAGPFVRTSRPMVDACLRTGTSYLDITGEIGVFESILRRDGEARAAGISLLPGVGFDVVPTDFLAARLSAQLPDATHLDLAFSSRGGGISRGTLKTMIEGLGHGGAIRRDGKIVPVPVAWDVREIPYDSGPRLSMTIPWGDVSTAYHTTGIPNIRVYTATPPRTVRRLRWVRRLLPLASLAPIRWFLQRIAERRSGPDASQRAHSHVDLWAEAWNERGERRSLTARVPDGYSFTAVSAVLATERLLAGSVAPGANTPARAFGSGFMDEILATLG
ncbi:MAG TPA: saccharopine dehydrogenase NADP-binding domain-containing protein [Thermoanaerobaculia bacterium]|nr:saccharopine dehydrogenase NADP-binding domain-containing protein [Thermoanaerobaculia bacterium]